MLPSYLHLYRCGELAQRIQRARELMSRCRLCPRACQVQRLIGETGFCRSEPLARVYKYKVHLGEEPSISGTRGSGIVFFSSCTLRCLYCQNTPMSHWGEGHRVSAQQLAQIYLVLQESGCHNLNLVTATHFMPSVLEALALAAGRGFHLPVVYNTSGYETVEVLRLLDGIVDIYLPDMKYARSDVAKRYSSAPDYPQVNRDAVLEMYRQVGNLSVSSDGLARRGLIVRHLILPHGLADTREVLRFIARDLSRQVHVSLMSQYLPLWSAGKDPLLGRRITKAEYRQAVEELQMAGLTQGWIQELDEACSATSEMR